MYEGPEKGPIEARTIDELAKKLSISPAKLRNTVETFNGAVADGTNTKLTPAKTHFAQCIDQAPFYAYVVTGGMTFTFGGIKISSKAEVLSNTAVIPGAYAAGEVTGGFFTTIIPPAHTSPTAQFSARSRRKNAADFARKRNPSHRMDHDSISSGRPIRHVSFY
jgi:tricarballylate dehydrogenase